MKYKKKVLTNIYKRVVGAMSGLAEINVELLDEVCPHYDSKSKTIRTFPVVSYARNDEEDFHLGRGIVIHEASHVIFAPPYYEIASIGKKHNLGPQYYEWVNIFLDVNNEYKVAEIFPHLIKSLADKTELIFQSKPEMLKGDNPMLQVLMRTDTLSKLKPEFPDNYVWEDFVKRTVKRFNNKGIYKATAKELLIFAKEVYFDFLNERVKKKKESRKNQQAIGELTKKMGQAIKEGKDCSGIKQEIKDLRKGQDGAGIEYDPLDKKLVRDVKIEGKEIDYSNLSLEEIKKMLKKTSLNNGASGKSWGSANLGVTENVTGTRPEVKFNGELEHPAYKPNLSESYKFGKIINSQLKKKVKLQEEFENRHRNGRLDSEEVRRQVSMSGRITKETIFQRKNTLNKGGEWAVSVLIDCSGSMDAKNKMREAKEALATLAYAFEGIPYIKYELTGFTYDMGIEDIQIKTFRERKLTMSRLRQLRPVGGNAEGHNIRSATKRLIKFGNMKKLLVVISDGQPAYSNGVEDTKKAVKLAKKFNVEVIGVGIEGANEVCLKEIYKPDYYMFRKTKEMTKDLTNLILGALGQKNKVRLVKKRWEV